MICFKFQLALWFEFHIHAWFGTLFGQHSPVFGILEKRFNFL